MSAAAPPLALLFVRVRSSGPDTARKIIDRLKLEFGPDEAAAAGQSGDLTPMISELKQSDEDWLGFTSPPIDPLRLADYQLHAYRLERLYRTDEAAITSAKKAASAQAPPPLRINFGYALPRQIVIAERCSAPHRLLIGGDPPADPVYAEILLARNESGDWRPAATPNAEPRFPHAVVDFLTALAARHPAAAASSSSAPAAAS